jgi:membrane protease YdiL (CAAX protease family)
MKIFHSSRPACRRRRRYPGFAGVWRASPAAGRVSPRDCGKWAAFGFGTVTNINKQKEPKLMEEKSNDLFRESLRNDHRLTRLLWIIGCSMVIYFLLRTASLVVNEFIGRAVAGSAGYLLTMAVSVLFQYVLPLTISMALLGGFGVYLKHLKALYKPPRNIAKALGNFPALYGLGQGANLITQGVVLIIALIFGVSFDQNPSYNIINALPENNVVAVVTLAVLMVVIAPIFEEFWLRGIVINALAPYGRGFAIILSSALFALMHGNFQYLPYTFALGLALGYIAYATGSLFAPTILHMMFNAMAVAALTLGVFSENSEPVAAALAMFYVLMFILVILGIAAFVKRIPVIRKYRIQPPKYRLGKAYAAFAVGINVSMWCVLALFIDSATGQRLAQLILNALTIRT